MYKTTDEIFGQHVSLRQTFAHMEGNATAIKDFFGLSGFFSLVFTGCGSSYSLCNAAALSMRVRGGLTSASYPAGDLVLNMPYYRDMLNGTLMMAISRSGRTTEVISAATKARKESGALIFGLTTSQNSQLAEIADLSITIPWANDDSSCATKSVTNLYMANLYNIGLLSGDSTLLTEIRQAADSQESFIRTYTGELEGVGQSGIWDNILVLADGELAGMGQAGAIAIERMTRITSRHCNILETRHDIITMVTPRTLVIVTVSPLEDAYQSALLRQIREAGAQLVTISSKEDNIFFADLNIRIPNYKNYAVRGIPALFVLQAIGYFRAITDGVNPDLNPGLTNWVRL